MPDIDKFLNDIMYEMKKKKLTKKKLSELTGLSETSMGNILNGRGGRMSNIRLIIKTIEEYTPEEGAE